MQRLSFSQNEVCFSALEEKWDGAGIKSWKRRRILETVWPAKSWTGTRQDSLKKESGVAKRGVLKVSTVSWDSIQEVVVEERTESGSKQEVTNKNGVASP